MDPIPRIVGFPSLRQSSLTVSNQTYETCYAHVIARCMRRLLYTFYDIPSETSIEEYYDEDNMDIEKYFEYSGMEMEDINVLHERPSRAIYNYYEHFSALVYLYFYNLAIRTNIVVFKDKNDGLNGGTVCKILFRICEEWIRGGYDRFISIMKAERYDHEYLLIAVYDFIYATNEDPHLEFQCFKSNFLNDVKTVRRMIEYTHDKLTKLDIVIETPRLSRMVRQLCDYALEHGYTCPFFCKDDTDLGHGVLIVGRESVDDKTIYKIKNSWGSECVGDVGFMNIKSNSLQLEDIYDGNCGLVVVLPKKIKQPNEIICDTMNDIVYGRSSSIEFNKRISELFDKEERVAEEERIAEAKEEETRRAEKRRVAEEERVVQVEEPRSARGRSPKRPSSKSPGRKSRSPGRKSRSPGRKSRSPGRKSRSPHRKTRSLRTRSLGGKNTLKKRRAHKKYYTVRKRK